MHEPDANTAGELSQFRIGPVGLDALMPPLQARGVLTVTRAKDLQKEEKQNDEGGSPLLQ